MLKKKIAPLTFIEYFVKVGEDLDLLKKKHMHLVRNFYPMF